MKNTYLFLHCDVWKSYKSMNPVEIDVIFRDTKTSRIALWHTIKAAINDKEVEVDSNDLAKVRDYVINGNPVDANDFINYGVIIKYYIHD